MNAKSIPLFSAAGMTPMSNNITRHHACITRGKMTPHLSRSCTGLGLAMVPPMSDLVGHGVFISDCGVIRGNDGERSSISSMVSEETTEYVKLLQVKLDLVM
ncbi:uncharacterized protein BO95DRAFT_74962 [Aspergillus brunneoviolaceus CBS 621.78]|uniref:Uncharacterized protein n=1 Tax=Aspergillus brunneoviolaceus CBS 621.78 TaxID=1450534 RepID=A0ACD1GP76_9EURO|nr:hypothetical protein BO95DRAFT_74962 [Aspergillus brunneoviolaceus CBS 621.78]RAH51042.1 hypothetical protein BO95DRAFT_74962 [Aspergillus brunneoviolaceus CBS 621.78]